MSAVARDPATAGRVGGLVLAGGRGTRMGGADKGLLAWQGGTLAAHAVARLAPQVARVAVSANRHLDEYARLGVPVVPDAPGPSAAPDGVPFDGPLAGVLAALDGGAFAGLPWLAVVPCDVPFFPPDLVGRLAAACDAAGASAAHAVSVDPATGDPQEQPLCCLVSRHLRGALAAHLAGGRRSARGFLSANGSVAVCFALAGDDPRAFVNANTPGALAGLNGPADPGHHCGDPHR